MINSATLESERSGAVLTVPRNSALLMLEAVLAIAAPAPFVFLIDSTNGNFLIDSTNGNFLGAPAPFVFLIDSTSGNFLLDTNNNFLGN